MAAPTVSAPTTTDELIALIRASGIHTDDHLDRKLPEFDLPDTAGGAAAILVRGGLLSSFQAKLLLAGRHRGFRLGTYVIKDQLGRGGMGTVYLAEHVSLRRKVAVKVLSADGTASKAGVERFLREARAAAALDHPNIVRVFDVLQHGAVHYLVMEYVDGRTLESLASGGGAMAPGRAVGYISQAAAGLQHAHEKGFVHRDIKPGNLMLAKDGTVKILDMGLARSVVDDTDRVTEQLDDGAVVGTADYISPEQAMNCPDIDIRADIYSLGATLFALVAGRPPFAGTPSQILMQHQMKVPPSLAEHDRTIAPGLAAVVAKMLAKKPADRYATPAEVIAALAPWLPNRDGAQKVMAGLSTSELGRTSSNLRNTLDEVLTSNSTRSLGRAKAARTRRAAIGGAVAAGLLVLGGVGYAVLGGSAKPDPVTVAGTPAATAPPPAGGTVAQKPTTQTPAKPTTRPAGTTRPATAGKSLFRWDAASVADFKLTQGPNEQESGTRPTDLPVSAHLSNYRKDTVGEYARETLAGRPGLGLAARSGEPSCQLTFQLEEAGIELAADREYVARFDYLTRGDGSGVLRVQDLKNNYRPYAETRFEQTDGQWRSGEVRFRKADGGVTRLAFQAPAGAADGMAYLGSLEVFDPTPTAEVAGERFTPLPLGEAATANSGPTHAMFSDHRRDRYELPEWGRREVSGVPFDLTPLPNGEGGRLIMLRGAAGRQAKAAPERVTLPVNRPAAAVHFLGGVAAWGWPFNGKESGDDPLGKLVLTVRLRYADGQTEEFPWRNGEQVADFVKHEDVPGSEFAFADDFGHQVRYLSVKPTRPGVLTAVELVKGEMPDLTPLVLAVTVEAPETTAAPAAPATAPVAPAAPAGKAVYRFDPAALPEFRGTKQGWDKVLYGSLPKLPAGLQLSSWKATATADFTRAVAAGRPALGFAARGADPTAEVIFNLNDLGVALAADQEYAAQVDYLTEADGNATLRAQEAGGSHPTLAEQPLEATAGQWRTAEVRFKKAPNGVTRLALQVDRASEAGMVHIGRLEVFDPAAAAAIPAAPSGAAAVGAKLFATGLATGAAFRGRFADGKFDGEPPALPAGVQAHCWKKESAAEFRSDGAAVGVTNLNDELSSQVMAALDDAPGGVTLQPGKRYVVRVEYKTANDAAGLARVLKNTDHAEAARASLAGTGGGWRWAEVPLSRPADPVRLVVENTAVGEGNTLWVRKVEVCEAK